MKIKLLILVFGIIAGSGICFLILSSQPLTHTVFKEFTSYKSISTERGFTCTYPQILSTYYKEGKVEHDLPEPETNPMIFSFSNFNNPTKGMASLSYLDSTKSITNVALAILFEDDEKVVLLENGGESYLTTYTVFKKQGVAIFSKQILFPILGGVPSGTMSMGTCI